MKFSLKNKNLTNTSNYVGPGFHKDMELKEVKTDVASNGSNLISFEFEGPAGKYIHKEFEMDRTHAKYQEKFEEYQFQRIGHILSAFLPTNKIEGIEDHMKGDTALEFWKLAIASLGTAHQGVKCELKVVHDSYTGYSSFPLFPNFVSSAFNEAKLVVGKRDIMETPKDDKPDVEKDVKSAATDATEDLEF